MIGMLVHARSEGAHSARSAERPHHRRELCRCDGASIPGAPDFLKNAIRPRPPLGASIHKKIRVGPVRLWRRPGAGASGDGDQSLDHDKLADYMHKASFKTVRKISLAKNGIGRRRDGLDAGPQNALIEQPRPIPRRQSAAPIRVAAGVKDRKPHLSVRRRAEEISRGATLPSKEEIAVDEHDEERSARLLQRCWPDCAWCSGASAQSGNPSGVGTSLALTGAGAPARKTSAEPRSKSGVTT